MTDDFSTTYKLLIRIKNALSELGEIVSQSTRREANKEVSELALVSLPPEAKTYYEAEQRERPERNRREKIRMRLEFGTVGTAILLAVLTLCTLRTLQRQLTAMQGQLTTAQDTEERQLRAYLLPDGATVKFSPDRHSYSVFVQIKNFGLTPAYTVNRWMIAEMVEAVPKPFDFFVNRRIRVGRVRPENVDLGNGQSICVVIKNIPSDARSPSQEKAIYVRGILKYWDNFQKCQFDAFVLQNIDPLGKGTEELTHVVNWATDKPSAEKYQNCAVGLPPPPLDPRFFDESLPEETDSVVYAGACPR